MDEHCLRVLLVEDDEDDYIITHDLLSDIKEWRFDLEWANTYEMALETMLRNTHDVYLVDYRLGKYTGLDLLHAAAEQGSTAPLILLTGQSDRAVDVEAMKRGAADYLVKGQITADSLERSIRYAIERKQAQEQLARLVRSLEERTKALEDKTREQEAFIYTIAHDLRGPLVSIRGIAGMLAHVYAAQLDSGAHLYIERITANTRKMQVLLDDLLELSRVGRVDVELTEVALDDLIDGIQEQLHHALTARGASVHMRGQLPTVYANPTRVTQIFTNLIDNAVKYTPLDRTPVVELAAVDHDTCWEIVVRDNGVGIPEAWHARIFDLFQRLPSGKALNPHGSGVGLAIVARIVQSHGGRLWLDSEEGIGTTFHLTLPKPGTGHRASEHAALESEITHDYHKGYVRDEA